MSGKINWDEEANRNQFSSDSGQQEPREWSVDEILEEQRRMKEARPVMPENLSFSQPAQAPSENVMSFRVDADADGGMPQEQPQNQTFTPQEPSINQTFVPQEPLLNQDFAPQEQPINQTFTPQEQPLNQTFAPQEPSGEEPAARPEMKDSGDADNMLSEDRFVLDFDEESWQNDETDKKKRKKGKKEKKPKRVVKEKISPARMIVKILISLFVLAIAVVASLIVVFSVRDIMGFNDKEGEVILQIRKNESVTAVAKRMQEKEVIESADLFRMYLKFSKTKLTIQFGSYKMEKGMAYEDAIAALDPANNSGRIKFTIPEGKTIKQISEILDEQGVCPADEFIDAVNNGQFLKQDGTPKYDFVTALDADPNKALRPYRLEGYLFPDTYEVDRPSEAIDVVDTMLSNFSRKFDDYARRQLKLQKHSIHEVVTMASMLEGEASIPNDLDGVEMKNVCGVFWNRLSKPAEFPKFQSDVTTNYGKQVQQDFGLGEEVRNAYDTYRCEGLPVGPISNPGMKSIEAALNPSKHKYYYFISDKQGTMMYATTYAEHIKNCDAAGLDMSLV